jgi:hypothetical protein
MMKSLFKPLTISVLAFASINAHAGLVETDWKTAGDARATLDESTGIEWLDLTETKDLHYSEVVAQLDTTFAGWRLPTFDEVAGLMEVFFPGAQYTIQDHYTSTSVEQRQQWVDLLGGVTGDLSLGLHTNRDAPDHLSYSGVRTPESSHNWTYQNGGSYSKSGTHSRSAVYNAAVFLVSDGGTTYSSINDPSLNANNANAAANVSVPVGLGVMGMGLLGLAFRRKQKALPNTRR